MEFPPPGQTVDAPTPTRGVPRTDGNVSREVFDAMRKEHSQRPKSGASDKTSSSEQPLFFDPVHGWYKKDGSNKPVPYNAGGKPHYDKSLGWVKPPTAEPARAARPAETRDVRLDSRAADVVKPVEKVRSEDVFSTTAQLLSNLPEKLQLKFQGKQASLETDMVKFMEAIPGVKLNDQARQIMDRVKRVQLQDGHVTMDLKTNFILPLQNDTFGSMVHGLSFGDARQQVSFDAAFDKSNNNLRISNVQGINVEAKGGRRPQIHELSINAGSENPSLNLTVDNPKKGSLLGALMPDIISLQLPMNALDRQLSPESVRTALHTAGDVKGMLEHRESIRSVAGIDDATTRLGIQNIIGSVRSVTKNGDNFEVLRNGPPLSVAAGSSAISFAPVIKFQVASDKGSPALSGIEGINVSMPMIRGLGLADEITVTPRKLSLDVDPQGRKFVKVHTD